MSGLVLPVVWQLCVPRHGAVRQLHPRYLPLPALVGTMGVVLCPALGVYAHPGRSKAAIKTSATINGYKTVP